MVSNLEHPFWTYRDVRNAELMIKSRAEYYLNALYHLSGNVFKFQA